MERESDLDAGRQGGELVDLVAGRSQEDHRPSAQVAGDWFGQTLDEYPLAVGAAIFAIGLAGGLAVPSTRPERKFMGPTRDKLMNQAQEVGSQLIDKGQEAAQKAVGAVKEATDFLKLFDVQLAMLRKALSERRRS